ncbi:LysR family transcriptional regulator [Aurantimonas sp. A2-1-M11]|uniref:winged helix-turn-helix domain-containing protein n=1 Tax=Aurantimonas sp. A2-1-M11 TaxID=3113712 RepID=UPI002F940B7C
MPTISLRFDLDGGRLGPGKVDLLERIDTFGSIAAAGRSVGMSYRRAWYLVADINDLFGRPLVEKHHGGKAGGGASLTELGRMVVDRYREAERATADVSQAHLAALQAEIDAARDD